MTRGIIHVTVDGAMRMEDPDRRAATVGFVDEVRAAFTFPNPALAKARFLGPWASGIDRTVCVAHSTPNGWTVIPRGGVQRLRGCAARAGVELRFRSRLVSRSTRRVPVEDLGIELRDYQRRGVDTMLAKTQCMLTLPCGGGKGTVGSAALVMCGEPGLVIAPTKEIRRQWVDTLRATGADAVYEITTRRDAADLGGAMRPGEVAVSLADPFHKHGGDALLRSAGAVVVDEAQHASCKTLVSILSRCPARYRWGLTATATREDGWGFMLPLLFGDTVVGATADELVQAGWLLRPTVIPVAVPFAPGDAHYCVALRCEECRSEYEHRPDSPRALRCTAPVDAGLYRSAGICGGALVEARDADGDVVLGSLCYDAALRDALRDPGTLTVVSALTAWAGAASRSTLVLLPRVDACGEYASALRLFGTDAEAVTGDVSTRRRRDLVRRLRDRDLACLVATQLADEGLDVPELDCLVVGFGGKAQWRAKQRVGRTARPSGMPPVVFDLVWGGGEAGNQWRKRAAAYTDEYGAECLATRAPVTVEDALRLADRASGTTRQEVRRGA